MCLRFLAPTVSLCSRTCRRYGFFISRCLRGLISCRAYHLSCFPATRAVYVSPPRQPPQAASPQAATRRNEATCIPSSRPSAGRSPVKRSGVTLRGSCLRQRTTTSWRRLGPSGRVWSPTTTSLAVSVTCWVFVCGNRGRPASPRKDFGTDGPLARMLIPGGNTHSLKRHCSRLREALVSWGVYDSSRFLICILLLLPNFHPLRPSRPLALRVPLTVLHLGCAQAYSRTRPPPTGVQCTGHTKKMLAVRVFSGLGVGYRPTC